VHLRYDGSRLGYIRRLVVQKHETKNSYEGEWPIGDELGSVLDWYIKTYRPLLASPGNDCLFPAGFGQPGPLSNAAMYNSIVNTVADLVGAVLNPHLFRCICACLILEHSPEALEDVRLMIGDKSLEMVLAHYVASQPRHAAKRTDELLRRLRRDSVHLIGDLANPQGRMPR
jgi:integrase